MTAPLALFAGAWQIAVDGDEAALELYERHYSARRYTDGRTRKLFVGPGEKLVLLTPELDALFVWRQFIDQCQPPQTGINCAVFRNEGSRRSSDLILEAENMAGLRWSEPGRFYTYVNSRRVRSTNPGYCFLAAGWRRCGRTRGGLHILEKVAA